MNEHLDAVKRDVEAGTVTADTLVLLFRACEEAEQARDPVELEETEALARAVVAEAPDPLRPEAARLLSHWAERFAAAKPKPTIEEIECPGCGRPVPASAVRCRACGTLLV